MIPEEKFKTDLIDKLNKIYPGWVNGDKEKGQHKKVDIINHSLKIAIEIKDDTYSKRIDPPLSGEIIVYGEDLDKKNKILLDDIRSANQKFKAYPGYKTILIIRTESDIADTIRYPIEGLYTYKFNSRTKKLQYVGRKTKYSRFVRKEIGCYLIFNGDWYYFFNKYANQNRVLHKRDIEDYFGIRLKEVPEV